MVPQMAEHGSTRLTATEAEAKAAECLALARRAAKPEHRIMLEHMAETWERIAQNLRIGN
jgi:hypothetical protein